ncbi:MAG: SDR family NAD(P)-dependent oxidoreductase [Alphaproteobacteria bacterium]|nr:SDR family NAD(P)-dependent oxidoreductase [Alphaproteobacteria bacterium]
MAGRCILFGQPWRAVVTSNTDKIAWITGGGSGIGAAVARQLAMAGWQVVISGRNLPKLQAMVAQHAQLANRLHPIALDVTDEDANRAVVRQILDRFGRIDYAMLNAGDFAPFGAPDWDAQQFRFTIEVNLMGVVHGLSALLPPLQAQGAGHLAIVSSVAGYVGLPNAAAYGASKAALINLAESLKPELEVMGIKMQLICPGFIATPMTDRNRFPMPFRIPAEVAAKRIVAAMASNRFEITMPRRFTLIMKLLRLLPYPLVFPITRRLLPQSGAGTDSIPPP